MEKKLSICIFAYKQLDRIKKQLDEIVCYDKENIEVVVSDDTTDDSIKELVYSYEDDRFRYVKNTIGVGADGNYLNAIISADSDYVWIFRSSDCVIADKISEVIRIISEAPNCSLYFFSSVKGAGLRERKYDDSTRMEVWHSGTLHPSGYIINKKYCNIVLYEELIRKYFDDYKASNVAFNLLQADLGLKEETLFSSVVAWKYALTVKREDRAENTPGGKNPFGLEFEYKRYLLMLDYVCQVEDLQVRRNFAKKVVRTYAKQILHIFGKRNSNIDFLNHYSCEPVEFDPIKERKNFIEQSRKNLQMLKIEKEVSCSYIRQQAFIYGIIKPTIYRVKHR